MQAAGRLWKHSRLQDVVGLVSPEEMAGMFLFTLVRNPWDRAVSYYHWLREQQFDHPAVQLAKRTDFAAFVAHPQTRASFRAESYGAFFRLPGRGELSACFVRLEHLAEDLAPVEAHLGFRLGTIPQANPSSRAADYRGYYSDVTRDLVAELYAEDIARFGYCF